MLDEVRSINKENLPIENCSNSDNTILSFPVFHMTHLTRITEWLSRILSPNSEDSAKYIYDTPLLNAMQYAVLNGGKRVRPLLVYATGLSLGAPAEKLDAAAVSIELIHAYSLIHDDLPSMDNDTLRRGQPTCHIAFDEATAILAGDALQALAFEVLADPKLNLVSESQRLEMVLTLSKASGFYGMVGGQAIDMFNTNKTHSLPMNMIRKETNEYQQDLESPEFKKLYHLHQKKTGALIETAIHFGAIHKVKDASYSLRLSQFAQKLGLLFQVQDDILDIEGSTEKLGKTQGKDQSQNKLTFPNLIGLSKTKNFANQLLHECRDLLQQLSLSETILHKLFESFVTRTY